MTDRVIDIGCSVDQHENGTCQIRLALYFDKEHCFRLVDHGPAIEDKAASEAFRKFWGDKAELRKFKDSSIKETVVWEHLVKERHLIVKSICAYTLKRHCGIEAFQFAGDQLEFAIPGGSFSQVIGAFEKLSKSLRSLSSLPLSIVTCESISSACRYSEVFVPRSISEIQTRNSKLSKYAPVQTVILRVEGSGKWPEDPQASNLLKQAFYLQISKLLAEQHHLDSSFGTDYLDILCDGYIFRCYITYTGEIPQLLRNGLDTTAAEHLLVAKPRHAKAIHGLYTSNIVYGSVVRLAKRFIASQMMSRIISEELTELLVASVFLSPERYREPVSTWSGFLHLLHLLSNFDWEISALFVKFQKDVHIGSEAEASISRLKPSFCVLVSASYDDAFSKPSVWSISERHARSWKEFTKLAAAASKYLTNNPDADLHPLFKRSPKAFDRVLNLDDHIVRRRDERLGAASFQNEESYNLSTLANLCIKNASLEADFLRFLPGFDPVECLLEDLERNFGKHATFFYDRYGGSMLGYRFESHIKDDAQRTSLHEKIRNFCKEMIRK